MVEGNGEAPTTPIGVVCEGCGQSVDPDTCCCGETIPDGTHRQHDPIPLGCRCPEKPHPLVIDPQALPPPRRPRCRIRECRIGAVEDGMCEQHVIQVWTEAKEIAETMHRESLTGEDDPQPLDEATKRRAAAALVDVTLARCPRCRASLLEYGEQREGTVWCTKGDHGAFFGVLSELKKNHI